MGKVIIIYASSFMGDNHKLHLFSFPSKLSCHNHFSLNKRRNGKVNYASYENNRNSKTKCSIWHLTAVKQIGAWLVLVGPFLIKISYTHVIIVYSNAKYDTI